MFKIDNIFTPCCKDCILNAEIQYTKCKYTLDSISNFLYVHSDIEIKSSECTVCNCLQTIENYLNKWYSHNFNNFSICIVNSLLIFIYYNPLSTVQARSSLECINVYRKWYKSKVISVDNKNFQVIDPKIKIPLEYKFGTNKLLKNYNIYRWLNITTDSVSLDCSQNIKDIINNISYTQLKSDFYKYYFKEEMYNVYTSVNLSKKHKILPYLTKYISLDVAKYLILPFIKDKIIKIHWCYTNKKDLQICYEKFKQSLKEHSEIGLIHKKSNNYLFFM